MWAVKIMLKKGDEPLGGLQDLRQTKTLVDNMRSKHRGKRLTLSKLISYLLWEFLGFPVSKQMQV